MPTPSPPRAESLYDVAVVGGGPAGVVVSRELARMGHQVGMVMMPRGFPAFEGLAERAVQGLEHAGCVRALSALGPRVQRSASWNGEQFDGNREHIVDRERFDCALADDARAAGVRVHVGRAARPLRHDDVWLLPWRDSDGSRRQLWARRLVEARGRRAPRYGLRLRRGPVTVAIGRMWRGIAGQSQTRIGTYENGWFWFACHQGAAMLQFFQSLERAALPAGERLENRYQAILERVGAASVLVEGLEPVGRLQVRDAGTSCGDPAIDGCLSRVGEAVLTIDPLAGHGIFEAVGGALTLAVTINTQIRRRDRDRIAQCFYRDRVGADYQRMLVKGRQFYALEQRWVEAPFWQERANGVEAPAAALDRLRVAERPVAIDDLVELREVLVSPEFPRGVWEVSGVPLVALLRLALGDSGLAGVDGAAAALRIPVEDVGRALTWLQSRRLISPRGQLASELLTPGGAA